MSMRVSAAPMYYKDPQTGQYVPVVGIQGATGKGIKSIRKTGTDGQTDTYTITYDDDSTSTYTLVNEANGEAYGAGKRNGVPVTSGDPAYQNNAPYYADLSRGYTDGKHLDGSNNTALSENNAKHYAQLTKELHDDISSGISTAVDDWLDEHPEATTTVMDGSITEQKLAPDVVTLIGSKISSSEKGASNGVAQLDSSGKIPSSQLPSYVDDVLEYSSLSAFPLTGESGKIYVALDTNLTYRWSGSTYIEISKSLALGETAETAFPGDRGKAVEDELDDIRDYVTPEMFGAKGDGITDDTEAIRNALEYAIQNEYELRFMEKTYIVTPIYNSSDYCAYTGIEHSFTILNGQSIVIDLRNATIKIGENNKSEIAIFFGFFADGVTIKNGTLVGDRYNESYGTGRYYDASKLLSFYDCINVHIENVKMIESKGDAIGFFGREKDQGSTIEFRDIYANNIVRNCIMRDCQRDAVTITKGRGLYFENCLMEDLGPLSPAAGVDIEPYYGNGSVFDVSFDNCTVKDTISTGIYLQNCDGAKVTNCKLSSFGVREAYDFIVSNNKIDGDFSIYTGTGTIMNNIISGVLGGAPRDNSNTESKKELHIIGNRILRGLQLYNTSTNPLVLEKIEIRDNYFERDTRTVIDIGSLNTPINYKKIVIKNNIIKRYGESGAYNHIYLKNIMDADISDNTLAIDMIAVNCIFIEIDSISGNLAIINNPTRFERLMYQNYTDFYPRFLSIANCAGLHSIIDHNTMNFEGYVPGIVRESFILYSNLTDCALIVINNYANKFLKLIEPSSNVKLIANNVLNDAAPYQSASGVSF